MDSVHAHRESRDQRSFDNSPRLFAVFHALLRLSTPRHPPCALSSLATLTQPSRLLERQSKCTTAADPIQLVRICLPTCRQQAACTLANLSKSLGEYTSNCLLAASNSPCISYYDATFHKQCRIVKDRFAATANTAAALPA